MITSVNDTNVWVSGINWPNGAGGKILSYWQERRFKHCTSFEILFEIIRILRKVFGFSDELLYDWYWLLLTGSTLVEPEFMPNVVQDDPDDDKFFACALASSAEYIVSEDKDLIRVGQYKTVRVISKQAFIQLIENEAR